MEIKDREAIIKLAVHPELTGEARKETLKILRKIKDSDLMEIIEGRGLLEKCVDAGIIGMTLHERLEDLTGLEWYEDYNSCETFFDGRMESVRVRKADGGYQATYWWNIESREGGQSARPVTGSDLKGVLQGVFKQAGEPLSDKVCELAEIEKPALRKAKRLAYEEISTIVGVDPDNPEEVLRRVKSYVPLPKNLEEAKERGLA
jgi:hypothetical protein